MVVISFIKLKLENIRDNSNETQMLPLSLLTKANMSLDIVLEPFSLFSKKPHPSN